MKAFLQLSGVPRLIGAMILFQGVTTSAQQETAKIPLVRAPVGAEPEKLALPGYGQLHRDFGFPGAVRVWERGMYLNPQSRRTRGLYGAYFPHCGGDGAYYNSHSSGFSNRLYRESYDNGYQAYSLRLNHAYALGVAPAEIQAPLAAQAGRALFEFQDVMRAGHQAFARADYAAAAQYFLLATRLNHGDPGSRLCAAHAEVALCHYENAALLVRRAFDLQPKLAYLSPDIRDAYGQADDFEDHIDDLRRAVEQSRSAKLWFLLGYYCQSAGDVRDASDALARARRLDPKDRVIARFAAAGP